MTASRRRQRGGNHRGSTPSNFTRFPGAARLIYLRDFCVRLLYPSARDIRLLYLQVGAVRLLYPSAGDVRLLLYLKVGDVRVYCTVRCIYRWGGVLEGGREEATALSRGCSVEGGRRLFLGELPLRGAARWREEGGSFLGSSRCAGLLN